jgi:hypothetical protein
MGTLFLNGWGRDIITTTTLDSLATGLVLGGAGIYHLWSPPPTTIGPLSLPVPPRFDRARDVSPSVFVVITTALWFSLPV